MNSFAKTVGRKSIALLFLAAFAGSLLAQSKGAKEAQKFKSQGEQARLAIEKTRDQFKNTVEVYNSFIQGKDKKIESGYKMLSQDVGKCEKMVEELRKKITGLEKTAEQFFATWEKEFANFSSESIRKKSEERLDKAKAGFEGMQNQLSSAGEAYKPFINSLNDQIQLLGMDLSADTLAALQEDAAPQFNQLAEELFQRIDQILNKEKVSHDQVDQALAEEESEAADDPYGTPEETPEEEFDASE